MPQKAHDQRRRDPRFGLSVGHGRREALHEHVEANAPLGVGLRVEEHLRPAHPVGARPAQVGGHQVVEVLLALQHRRALIVDVQERLQIGERVGGPHRGLIRERQRHPVAPGQLEQHLRLQRPLDVQMQLRLGQPPHESSQTSLSHRSLTGHRGPPESGLTRQWCHTEAAMWTTCHGDSNETTGGGDLRV